MPISFDVISWNYFLLLSLSLSLSEFVSKQSFQTVSTLTVYGRTCMYMCVCVSSSHSGERTDGRNIITNDYDRRGFLIKSGKKKRKKINSSDRSVTTDDGRVATNESEPQPGRRDRFRRRSTGTHRVFVHGFVTPRNIPMAQNELWPTHARVLSLGFFIIIIIITFRQWTCVRFSSKNNTRASFAVKVSWPSSPVVGRF